MSSLLRKPFGSHGKVHDITLTTRGKGTNTRHINNIAMENEN
ncbi:MAG: hypothetical protein ACFB3T_09395 [Geminicoccaceae bacterium]